jgi:hypothetical protein
MTDAEIRGKLLKVFYDLRYRNGGWLPTSDMNLSGIDRQVMGAICEQLKDGGLIHWKPLKGAQEGFVIGMAKITAIGVDVVDGVRKPPIAIQFHVSFSSPASPAQTDVVDNKTSEGQPSSGSGAAAGHQKPPAYDVALSFAGEDRDYVAEVARLLRDQNVKVFYDAFEEARLWGKDLYEYLTDVYQHHAKFAVIFISEAYGKKLWTNHERKAAQARAFKEAKEYILPARFDDTEIPGILPTTGYLSLRDKPPEQLVAAIISKLGRIDDNPELPQVAPGPLRVDVGEAGGFFKTGRAGSLYTHTRTLNIRVSNTDHRRPLTGCRIKILNIEPHEYDGPWVVKEGFSLAPGDHEFVPLARYVEPDDIKLSPYGATFFEVLTEGPQPRPPATAGHILTIRATAMESPFCDLKCKLWVDEDGRLRIESGNS